MGSEQSSLPPKKPSQRPPPVRRGHTIAVSNVPESRRSDPLASGNNSPGASVCSDSELPYISYTVDRPIGDSPKTSSKGQRSVDKKSLLQRRQVSVPARRPAGLAAGAAGAGGAGGGARAHDIVVVRAPGGEALQEDIQRLQEIPTFLPIMRGTLGLPGARDPEVLEGLPWRALGALAGRLAAALREADSEISKLYGAMVEKQRSNARHAERLSRVREVAHQLARCGSLLAQTLQDVEELNALLPAASRLERFQWEPPETAPPPL
ncbi:BLOC-1-related complex subunit 5 isoform X2 [Amyelois transitella]|uniref:BLOC-1-related complex subunit 5 isoform X2 n=1 Tax=Amyelois transitella TaxID=680683 RepID=UPI0029901A0B|nr:BLOC-1-related complex subunit 5 isoform X2 [Amyelois transitella]